MTVLRKSKTKTKGSGPQCCSHPPNLNPSSGSGHVEKLGGLDTYLVGSPDSKVAVLLVSDIFGYDAPNLRKLADKLAAGGFFVVVPDFFYGDPFVLGEEGFAAFPGWIKHHGTDKALEDAKAVLEALKGKGISAVGAVGFCYGAKVVVELSKHNLIQAAAMCHPSLVTLDDIKAVKVPTQILGAEIDHMSPPEVVKQFEEALAAKPEIKSRVKIFPKVEHGWTTRYNDEDEAACKAAEEAHQDLLEWFLNHVKCMRKKNKETTASSECCSNPPALNPSSGSGHIEKLGGFNSYVTGSPDSSLSVLLVHDAFGYEAPKARKLADKIAAAGFIVVLPDFVNGDPFSWDHTSIPVWKKAHAPEKTIEDAKLVIEALRSKGVSAIGAAGFCWGAKGVVDLAKHDFIQAAVLCHPSAVTLDDIKAVKVPISVLGAEIDQMYPPEVIKQFEEVLTAKPEIKSHVKIFPKVAHGWTLRYNDEDEAAVKAAEEAHQDLLAWFLEHVK